MGLAIVKNLNDLYTLTCTGFTVYFICSNISLDMCIDQCSIKVVLLYLRLIFVLFLGIIIILRDFEEFAFTVNVPLHSVRLCRFRRTSLR